MKNLIDKFPFLVVIISMISAVASIGLCAIIIHLCISNPKIANDVVAISVMPVGGLVLIFTIHKLSNLK